MAQEAAEAAGVLSVKGKEADELGDGEVVEAVVNDDGELGLPGHEVVDDGVDGGGLDLLV